MEIQAGQGFGKNRDHPSAGLRRLRPVEGKGASRMGKGSGERKRERRTQKKQGERDREGNTDAKSK